ncbi:MAG: PEP-CTERM sorting domain-containing protein [Pseudomonadota bacterium]
MIYLKWYKYSWIIILIFMFWLNCVAAREAAAAVILDYDHRSINTTGTGQVQGHAGNWLEHSAPTPMSTSYNESRSGEVTWFDLPVPPHSYDFFALYGYAAQESLIQSNHFSAMGSVVIDTGDNNSTLDAAGAMSARSIFDVGFSLNTPHEAAISALLELTSVPGYVYSSGDFAGSALLRLIDIDHSSTVFEYIIDESELFGSSSISTNYHLDPGSYALIAGVASDFSFTGYADLCDTCGSGNYNLDFRLTSIPEPSVVVLLGIGLLGIGLAGRRRSTMICMLSQRC